MGARFESRNRHPALGKWPTVSYVTELDAPRRFAWAVVDADGRFGGDRADPGAPMATCWFALAPDARGVVVSHGVRLGPARSGLSLTIDRAPHRREALVRARPADPRSGIRATLDGMQALAEPSR